MCVVGSYGLVSMVSSLFSMVVISWQMCVVGSYGLVSMVSSLFSMVVSTLTLPILPVLALLPFDDKINSLKVMEMVVGICFICIWRPFSTCAPLSSGKVYSYSGLVCHKLANVCCGILRTGFHGVYPVFHGQHFNPADSSSFSSSSL
ncbi:hypothetical protein SUGI_0837150 [Cryptomeria japonica]|nr:hypothetical protein SUGI_0837150 [Cryptomeria japonica]